MNSRWLSLINVSLAAFASLVIAWQVLHFDLKSFDTDPMAHCHPSLNLIPGGRNSEDF